jgi:uncharacterized protein (DUF58 family)
MGQPAASHKPFFATSFKNLFAQAVDDRGTEPTILELRHEAEKAIRNLPPITAPAGRLVHSLIRGVHGRRRSGPGDSFWQYRPFYPGDMHTDIDWRRSAKSDNLFVRQKEWESAQNVFLWCDASPSMHFASHPSLHTKQEKAIMLGLAAAILLVEGGERIGYLGNASEKPTHATVALERLMRTMNHHRRSDSEVMLPPAPNSRYAHAILISDFLIDEKSLRASLQSYSDMGVTGQLVQVLDPAEVEFPFRGRVRLMGLEGEATQLLPQAQTSRRRYKIRLRAWQDTLAHLASEAGWSYTIHHTDQPMSQAVLGMTLGHFGSAGEAMHQYAIHSGGPLREPHL